MNNERLSRRLGNIYVARYLDDALVLRWGVANIQDDLKDYCETNDIDADEYGVG